jgi:hypothetical protein
MGKPSEDKFRNIKKTNPKVASTLFALKGDIDGLVKACGYSVKDADFYTYLGNNLSTLRKAYKSVEVAVEPAQMSLMSADELKKHKIVKAQMAEVEQMKENEKKYKAQIARDEKANKDF